MSEEGVSEQEVQEAIEQGSAELEKFQSAIQQLPKVDEDGNSECPFARELYEQAREALGRIQGCYHHLLELVPRVDAELAKLQNDLQIIVTHAGSLDSTQAKGEFDAARDLQYRRIERLTILKTALLSLAKVMEMAISLGREKISRMFEEKDELDSNAKGKPVFPFPVGPVPPAPGSIPSSPPGPAAPPPKIGNPPPILVPGGLR
ncbi:hypothetical protein FJY63_06815 [Candidatus Sumerlaeota bacterium]|nr:hypothetical protein [Candidatus Sumerlaeota bacterium]